MSGVLNREELDAFMVMSEGTLMHADVHAWILNTFEVGPSKLMDGTVGLTKKGFFDLYLYMYDQSGKEDENVLLRDLKFLGFNSSLKMVHATTYVLSTHSNNNMARLQQVPYDLEAYEAAITLPLLEGKPSMLDDAGDVVLLTISNKWGVSLAVSNNSGKSSSEGAAREWSTVVIVIVIFIS